MNTEKIITSARHHRRRIWTLKANVLNYIAKNQYATATDLDKALGFSSGRRANDLLKIELLKVEKKESCQWIGERFYYILSLLGEEIIKQSQK